jgi:hypothetical protein
MSEHCYYNLRFEDEFGFEVIVRETEWKIVFGDPSFPEDVHELLYLKIDGEWEKMEYEFIVIYPHSVVNKTYLGFNCYNDFPPGFFEM